MNKDAIYRKVLGCLVGGLIGDAMGAPVEGWPYARIVAEKGYIDNFEGGGTDDSAIKLILCEALIKNGGHVTADDFAESFLNHKEDYGLFFVPVRNMFHKIQDELTLPVEAGRDNAASSSSAMSIAPIGIVNACDPRTAAAEAYEAAGLIHSGCSSFCRDGASAIAAAVAEAFRPGATVEAVLDAAVAFLHKKSAAAMRGRIGETLALARASACAFETCGTGNAGGCDCDIQTGNAGGSDFGGGIGAGSSGGGNVTGSVGGSFGTGNGNSACGIGSGSKAGYFEFRKRYYETAHLYNTICDSRETVPVALALFLLAGGDASLAVEFGANFGRDADTIATMAGAIAGAYSSIGGFRRHWVANALGKNVVHSSDDNAGKNNIPTINNDNSDELYRLPQGSPDAVFQEKLAEDMTDLLIRRYKEKAAIMTHLDAIC